MKYSLSFTFCILSISGVAACSIAVTRPVQEMSNAEVALHAAKDLNADSLVPEIYRNATDQLFKAKKSFRLKKFDEARRYALKATRLAEQAEFEAYRLGGATPEISSQLPYHEGASQDPESAFKEIQKKNKRDPSLPPEAPSSTTSPKTPEDQKPTEFIEKQPSPDSESDTNGKNQNSESESLDSGRLSPKGAFILAQNQPIYTNIGPVGSSSLSLSTDASPAVRTKDSSVFEDWKRNDPTPTTKPSESIPTLPDTPIPSLYPELEEKETIEHTEDTIKGKIKNGSQNKH